MASPGMDTVVLDGELPLSGASLIQQRVGGGFMDPSTLLSRDLGLFLAVAWQHAGVGLAWDVMALSYARMAPLCVPALNFWGPWGSYVPRGARRTSCPTVSIPSLVGTGDTSAGPSG